MGRSPKRATLEIGNNVRRGFTLIEFIIVIALFALVGGLIVINAESMLRGLGEEPVDRILQKAVREARFQAAFLKESTELRFDEETALFMIHTRDGRVLDTFSTGMADSDRSLRISFEQILPEEGLNRRLQPRTAEIDAVVFRPDRSSTPFQVIVSFGQTQFTQRYDPFSDIVIQDSRER